MTITAWRIVKRKFLKTAFTGEDARRYGGRWNSKGIEVVYLAESQSLAALEILVHLDSAELLEHYLTIPVTFDSQLTTVTRVARLPKDWRKYPAPKSLRLIGDTWVSAEKSPVLRVPSALVLTESNFLLNPRHRQFSRLRIGKPVAFSFDLRLFPDA